MNNVCEADRTKPYSKGVYNKTDESEQWIRLSEGCPNKCQYCRESFEIPKLAVFEIPEISRNIVKILDMNLLCHPEALEIIRELGRRRVGGKVVKYELICGVDYRFLTEEIAVALKQARFVNIRIGWDFEFNYQRVIKERTKMLLYAGYAPTDITVFMICNWKITYQENIKKLDLCKVWNFKVSDAYFDNQISPNIKPVYWSKQQIRTFRHMCRKHNQLVNFKLDPETYLVKVDD